MQQIAEIQSIEPEGIFQRKVWLVPRTSEAALVILDHINALNANTGWETPTLLPRLINLNTYTVQVDEIGVMYVNFIKPTIAQVHVFFWDRRLRGRERLCRAIALLAMDTFQLDQLWTVVPKQYTRMKGFVERVGFQLTAVHDDLQTFAISRLDLHDAKTRGVE